MSKLIYLDNAATTKTAPEVVEAMLPYFSEYYGNPSSVYSFAAKIKEAVTKQREIIADAIGAKANEIYFTAGGTESDNWAIKAAAEAYESKGKHIITSKIEHHAVLHTCEYLEKHGFEVTYLNVDENGVVDLEELKKAIRPDTILISNDRTGQRDRSDCKGTRNFIPYRCSAGVWTDSDTGRRPEYRHVKRKRTQAQWTERDRIFIYP